MRHLALFFLLLAVLDVSAQNVITGTVSGLNHGKIELQSIFGERIRSFDSVYTDAQGRFRMEIRNRLPGMYRLAWSKDQSIDLIWNNEDIGFATSAAHPEDSLVFLQSVENIVYQKFTRLDKLNQEKLQLLVPLVDYYPVRDAFLDRVRMEFESIQRDQIRFLDSLAGLYPRALAVRMARIRQGPFVPVTMQQQERIDYLKKHFFDHVNFSDTALLRSTVFPDKTIAYLSFYSNNRLTQKQLEAEFIKAVNVILGAASVNPDLFRYMLDYLVSGFDKFHFDDVIAYIADNFQDPGSCEDQERKSSLQKKLETFQKLAVGKIAPELEVPDPKGKQVRLSQIAAEYTLLVFWSTECPHCLSMIPRMKELYNGQKPKRFEVMAVSIDTKKEQWVAYLKEEKLSWINGSDLQGFYGPAADAYNIYATPTIFLLDRDKKILAKPITLMDMEQSLRDHQLIR